MRFKIRKDIEMHNLAKGYLTEVIKEECWNAMAVKGRALKVKDTKPWLLRIFNQSLMAQHLATIFKKKIHM